MRVLAQRLGPSAGSVQRRRLDRCSGLFVDHDLQIVAFPQSGMLVRAGTVELMDGQLSERLLVRGVGLDDVGQPAGQVLDGLRVVVDPEHLGPLGHELEGEGLAEPPQSDDDHASRAGLPVSPSQ